MRATKDCTFHTCENGHIWPAQLGLKDCNGCQTPILAIRMVNCPICNEPSNTTTLRIDHIGGSHPFTQVCRGEKHVGPEYFTVKIDHRHADRDNHTPVESAFIEL